MLAITIIQINFFHGHNRVGCHSEEEFTSWCADVTLSPLLQQSGFYVIATQLSLTVVSFQTRPEPIVPKILPNIPFRIS